MKKYHQNLKLIIPSKDFIYFLIKKGNKLYSYIKN